MIRELGSLDPGPWILDPGIKAPASWMGESLIREPGSGDPGLSSIRGPGSWAVARLRLLFACIQHEALRFQALREFSMKVSSDGDEWELVEGSTAASDEHNDDEGDISPECTACVTRWALFATLTRRRLYLHYLPMLRRWYRLSARMMLVLTLRGWFGQAGAFLSHHRKNVGKLPKTSKRVPIRSASAEEV